MRIASLFMLTLGCDATVPTAETAPSQRLVTGSRIHEWVWVGSDGSEVPKGLWDDRAGIPCTIRTAPDGVPRCLPIVDRLAEQYFSTEGFYYADAACTQVLAFCRNDTCRDVGPEAVWRTYGGEAFLVLGPQHTGDIYVGNSTQSPWCRLQTFTSPIDFYRVGAEVPFTAFVEFVEAVRP